MKRLLFSLIAGLSLIAAQAFASPLAAVNTPFDTMQATVNSGVIAPLNAGYPPFSPSVACSGTTTATCTGIRLVVSVTGLTTAAGVTSATMTVTDTLVTASSSIFCQANGYGGTGNPMPVVIVPGAGSFTFAIENTHASSALNATVPVSCFVYN